MTAQPDPPARTTEKGPAMSTEILTAVALAAATAYSPGKPDTRRARAYAAWYLKTFTRTCTDPATLPGHAAAMARYAHETDGTPA